MGLGLGVIALGVVILVGITRRDDGGQPVPSPDILEALVSLDLLVAIVAGWLIGQWVLRVLHRQGFR